MKYDNNMEVSHATRGIKNDGKNVFVWLRDVGTNIMKSLCERLNIKYWRKT